MNIRCHNSLVWIVFLAFFATLGCTQTIVPLGYEPVAVNSLKCKNKLNVAAFEDLRPQTRTIGTTRKGYSFYAESYVEDWFSRALVQQLRATGCPATLVRQGEPSGNPVIQGKIRQISLHERARTKYEAALKLTLVLINQGKTIHEETFSVRMQKTVLPKGDTPRNILREAMQDLLREAVPKLIEASHTISS